jgi:hypothetical protein
MRPIVATSATVLIVVGLVLLEPAIGVDGLGMLAVFVGLWWLYRSAVQLALRVGIFVSFGTGATRHASRRGGGWSG